MKELEEQLLKVLNKDPRNSQILIYSYRKILFLTSSIQSSKPIQIFHTENDLIVFTCAVINVRTNGRTYVCIYSLKKRTKVFFS